MERSVIRVVFETRCSTFPDFTSLHPGYDSTAAAVAWMEHSVIRGLIRIVGFNIPGTIDPTVAVAWMEHSVIRV
jgi:hypothetical protein